MKKMFVVVASATALILSACKTPSLEPIKSMIGESI
jgi:hypothetical protein